MTFKDLEKMLDGLGYTMWSAKDVPLMFRDEDGTVREISGCYVGMEPGKNNQAQPRIVEVLLEE